MYILGSLNIFCSKEWYNPSTKRLYVITRQICKSYLLYLFVYNGTKCEKNLNRHDYGNEYYYICTIHQGNKEK